MRFPDVLQLAWTGLRQNKLRSGLTSVGVTVGVFAFTTIVSLGGGLERAVVDQLTDDENPNRIIVRPGFGPMEKRKAEILGVTDPVKIDRLRKSIAKRRRGGPAQMRRTLLTIEALEEVRARPEVARVRPLAIDRFAVTSGEHSLEGALSFGIVPTSTLWNRRVILGDRLDAPGAERGVWLHEYLLYRWGLRSDAEQATIIGQTITLARPREGSGVAAMLSTARAQGLDVPISDEQAEALFAAFSGRRGQADGGSKNEVKVDLPIRGVIRERIEEDGFEVWEDSFSMQADLFLPQAVAQELYEQVASNTARGYNAAAVEARTPEQVKPLEKALREEGFQTVSIDTILERVGRAMATITAIVSGLTVIALVVAVIGIVNTMVMNVSERTREIGILKALGATDGDIRSLFLVESGMIGLFGGVTGVLLALASSVPGDHFTRVAIREATQYGYDGSVFSFEPWLVLLAVGCAVLLSVLAALGPATRAASVDPTVALRDE